MSRSTPPHPRPLPLPFVLRRLLRAALLAAVLPLLSAAATPSASAASSAPSSASRSPNIVFILADDLGWADVAFHGGPAPTPHLDRLAREGLELAAHTVAPVCSPTRTGLLTGRVWSRFGVTSPQNERALPWDTVTLPLALRSRGYATALVGKWHLGSRPDQGPQRFGFDHSYGSLAGGVSPYSHGYKQGPFTATWHRGGTLVAESGHVTDLLTAEAVRWLEARDRAQPFFLYLPYTAVHLPVKEPAEWLARVPAAITGEVARHYAAAVMHLDDAVGRIVATLEKTGARADTLLVFTSDNGGSTAENNDRSYPDDGCPSGRLPGSNLPWRGQKGELYEGGVRVPTLVSWPGRIRPGRVDAPVQITDWFPTFAALAGYRPDRDLKWDGTDLRPLLTAHTPPPARAIYAVAPGWRAQSLRHDRWKLIVHAPPAAGKKKTAPATAAPAAAPASSSAQRSPAPVPPSAAPAAAAAPAPREELFDLVADPGETTNLAARHPEILAAMRARLAAAAARDRDALPRD